MEKLDAIAEPDEKVDIVSCQSHNAELLPSASPALVIENETTTSDLPIANYSPLESTIDYEVSYVKLVGRNFTHLYCIIIPTLIVLLFASVCIGLWVATKCISGP